MDVFVISSMFSSIKLGLVVVMFSFGLAMILILLGSVLGESSKEEWAKLTSFECGFDALSSSRAPFSLRFFLLSLLFLVFDMEVVLLLPFIYSLKSVFLSISMVAKMLCVVFILVLFLGLMHEYNEGTLDWVMDK
uniref:NADH dehydrogenase subunit 3 n=1 Tax=Polymesoda caroliniana TaxID=98308 RepID=UPI002A837D6A|nr:NADH dehydrogenase subunit 3 [Polymesoda caroliniana]WOV69036.1 NADH dehydrogenase subunit 3 [Polymesoda caroliniana]